MSLRSFGRGLRDRVQEILNRGTQTTRVLLCCYSSANFFLKSHSIHSSLILHNIKVFIQQNRVLKEPLMLTKSREILKSHLFRNHMRKVIGVLRALAALVRPVGRRMVGYSWLNVTAFSHIHRQTQPSTVLNCVFEPVFTE